MASINGDPSLESAHSIADQEHQRLELMAEVARLYYEEQMNQSDIGQLFGISPSTVSRLLKEAHKLEMVHIVIRHPFKSMRSLSERLQAQLNLREAYVVPSVKDSYVESVRRAARFATRVLEDHLQDGMTLGISLGMAVAETAKAFRPVKTMRCLVVRLQGANDNELMEGTDLAHGFATQLGNEFLIIPAPWIMSSQASCEVILSQPTVQDAIRLAERADVALVGMGSMESSISTLLRNHLITAEELAHLRATGAAGEICGKHFDHDGSLLDVPFSRRTVAVDISKLRDIRTVIGVAAGEGKAEAILAASKGGLIDILVTDSQAATRLLDMIDS